MAGFEYGGIGHVKGNTAISVKKVNKYFRTTQSYVDSLWIVWYHSMVCENGYSMLDYMLYELSAIQHSCLFFCKREGVPRRETIF